MWALLLLMPPASCKLVFVFNYRGATVQGASNVGSIKEAALARASRFAFAEPSHVAAAQSQVPTEVDAHSPTRTVTRMRVRGSEIATTVAGASTRVWVVNGSSNSQRSRSTRTTMGRA